MDTPNQNLQNDEVDSCLSCWDDFPQAGKLVSCACGAKICENCVKTYLLGSDMKSHCMKCEGNYTMSFCIENLGRGFMTKKYRDHRKNILFGMEKSRFPETMPEVVFIRNKRQLSSKTEELRKQKDLIRVEIRIIEEKTKLIPKEARRYLRYFTTSLGNFFMKKDPLMVFGLILEPLSLEDFQKLNKKKQYQLSLTAPLYDKISAINVKIQELWHNAHRQTSTKTSNKHIFTQKCSVEDCEGFLTEKWVCELCDNKTCRRCLETKNDKHVCNQDDIETVKLIKKTTRNCPGCATAIHRIESCDQMWCTQCNVPFSYKTGKKINGPVHNPHFFQWLKENPGANPQQNIQQNRENQCREPLNGDFIRYLNVTRNVSDKIYEFYRLSLHFRDNVLNKAVDREKNNLDLRVKFMMKEQNETRVKRTLHTRQNKRNKELEFIHLYEFMATIMVEKFHQIAKQETIKDLIPKTSNLGKSDIFCIGILREVEEARKYCNKELKKISKAYGHKSQEITNKYNVRYINVIK